MLTLTTCPRSVVRNLLSRALLLYDPVTEQPIQPVIYLYFLKQFLRSHVVFIGLDFRRFFNFHVLSVNDLHMSSRVTSSTTLFLGVRGSQEMTQCSLRIKFGEIRGRRRWGGRRCCPDPIAALEWPVRNLFSNVKRLEYDWEVVNSQFLNRFRYAISPKTWTTLSSVFCPAVSKKR
ncbi:hypothetical protein C366_04299 [Cryptococcus neoformans Tu401-1]|nr:hypothetical protein C366_04299 [Cryptococcus neoformans var. grubii Tu401-1]OXM78344.1 hypothetical protein C364_04283 [Cryptococcus neoformans var. grubii Bt63]